MTELLKHMMSDRADSLGAPDLDVLRMVREGNRRASRRRAAVLGAGAAAAVVAVVAVPVLLPAARDAGREVTPTSVFVEAQPAYATGSTVHVGHQQFDVGHDVSGLVVTTEGMVFTDGEGTVYASDGSASPVGIGSNGGPGRLVGDGSRAAWIEYPRGAPPEYTVYDQATGEVTRSPFRTGTDGATEYDAALFAVDGDDVWFRDSRGVVRWDLESGAQTELGRPLGAEIQDVKSGVIAHSLPREGTTDVDVFAGNDFGEGGPLALVSSSTLNPSGTRLLGVDPSTDPALADTVTGDVSVLDIRGYEQLNPYAWLDDDTYAAVAVTSGAGPRTLDLLTCEVDRECTLFQADISPEGGGLALDMGYAGSVG